MQELRNDWKRGQPLPAALRVHALELVDSGVSPGHQRWEPFGLLPSPQLLESFQQFADRPSIAGLGFIRRRCQSFVEGRSLLLVQLVAVIHDLEIQLGSLGKRSRRFDPRTGKAISIVKLVPGP